MLRAEISFESLMESNAKPIHEHSKSHTGSRALEIPHGQEHGLALIFSKIGYST